MSNRFLGLYLAILIISNIFFFSIFLEDGPLTYSDMILGKIINQSCHLLILFYIIFKKYISFKDTVIICVFCIQLLDIANEFINYLSPFSDTVAVDMVFVMSQRVLWSVIFVTLGSNFISNSRLKNILNLAFGSFIFCLFLSTFESLDKLQPNVVISLLILYIMIIYGSNFKDKILHQVGIGVLLVVLADMAFLFSGLHDDLHWKYLYLLPRLLLNLGELLILYKVLEKYRLPTLPLTPIS